VLIAEITKKLKIIKEDADQINAQPYKYLPRMVLVEIVLSSIAQIQLEDNASRFNAQQTLILLIKDNA